MRKLFPLLILFISLHGIPLGVVGQHLPPLLQSILNNDTVSVKNLVEKGASLQVVDSAGDHVLHYAALYSTPGCLDFLLKKGADPNAKNKLGETALIWCTHDLQKTKILVEYGADVNLQTLAGNSPLLVACVGTGQRETIEYLLKKGADPLVKNKRKGTTLMRVALYGDTTSARLLLSRGVSINDLNFENETALLMAVRSVNKEMVHWLLANGADVNLKDNYKATALSYAVVVNEPDILRPILEKTSNINQQDIDGMSYLMWATYNEYDNPAMIQLLLDKGAATDLKDNKGDTALSWALKKGHTATVELLKKAGAK